MEEQEQGMDVANWEHESYRASAEREDDYSTDSGIPVRPLYTSADLTGWDERTELGLPGLPPFTRGIYPTMYRGRLWTVRQLAGFGTPEDTNLRIRMLLANGATGVNAVFDYATNRGFDSDLPLAEGDVGQGGVAVDSLQDMVTLFKDIPLDKVSVSLVLSHPVGAGIILAMFLAVAQQRDISFDRLAGTIQNDFLMETVALTAPEILDPRLSFKLSMDVVEYCVQYVPRWNPISFAGYNYRETGANAVQEAGLVIAHAITTVQEMVRRGYPVDSFAPLLSSFFSADSDLFEEIAKYRAARRIYARIMRERFGAQDPRSLRLRFHVQTSGSALTAQQPLNNITRAAYHALTAVLGGAQSLHVSAYDEALCVPSEAAALTALRTQQILIEETGITRTIDPLGGSYYVEALTREIEDRISDYLGKIEKMGGLVAAVEQGWVHRELSDNAYRREAALTSGQKRRAGVNCYTEDKPIQLELFHIPDALEKQKAKLTELRQTRNSEDVINMLRALRRALAEDANTMPYLIQAVRVGATLGECANVFREFRGGWRQPLL